MASRPPLRIVHGFEEVSGQVAAMAAAQSASGAEASSMVFRPHAFGYGDATQRSPFRARAMWRSLVQADVVHLYFGTSLFTLNRLPDYPVDGLAPAMRARRLLSRLFWMRDLPLLKALGKTVAMTFLGDDIRQVDGFRRHRRTSHLTGAHGDALSRYDARKRRLAALADRYADLIYVTNPDLLEVVPERARFLPYIRPAVPLRPQRFLDARPLRIVHAPSNRAVKGTDAVERAAAQLRGAGHAIELDLVTGAPHAEVLARMARAHVFVDQLLVGWYGVAATEALSLGCLTLAYLDEGDLARAPTAMTRAMPIRNVDAGSLATAIAAIATTPQPVLAESSARGCEWVEHWHGAPQVAGQVLEDYERIRSRRR